MLRSQRKARRIESVRPESGKLSSNSKFKIQNQTFKIHLTRARRRSGGSGACGWKMSKSGDESRELQSGVSSGGNGLLIRVGKSGKYDGGRRMKHKREIMEIISRHIKL
jgi:hypothetical protein